MINDDRERLILRIPKDLKVRIMNISHFRKINDKPSATMNAVVIELISKNIEEIEEDEQLQKIGA